MPIDLTRLAADLREARRYARCNPEEAKRQASACVATINDELGRPHSLRDVRRNIVLERLATNLCVGVKFALISPELLGGYLFNTAFEMDVLIGSGPAAVAEEGAVA